MLNGGTHTPLQDRIQVNHIQADWFKCSGSAKNVFVGCTPLCKQFYMRFLSEHAASVLYALISIHSDLSYLLKSNT